MNARDGLGSASEDRGVKHALLNRRGKYGGAMEELWSKAGILESVVSES